MKNEIFNSNIFKLIDICKPNNDKNIIVSGTSIKFAFAMLLNGAEGKSKDELISFLGKGKDELNLETSKILEEVGDDLKLADSFWVAEPNKATEEYKQIIKTYQNAEINVENFQLPETVDKINNWISAHTNGLIDRVLNDVSNATSVLINTLYFKAQWEEAFTESLTHTASFYGTEKTSEVQMMKKTTKVYFENEYAKGFNLYYENSPYEFIGVLPNKEGEFKIEELDLNNFNYKAGNYRVNVNFPKLDIEFGDQLKNVLRSLGVNAIFDEENDLNCMLSIPQKVDAVIHKTRFKLDEKGTEAAAATVITMIRGMAMVNESPIEINLEFNRPFAFMIRHRETHDLLFVGKINNL